MIEIYYEVDGKQYVACFDEVEVCIRYVQELSDSAQAETNVTTDSECEK